MSGIYAALGEIGEEARKLATALCAQVCSGSENLCSYASDAQVLLGIGTHDFLDKGAMPVLVEPTGLWVLMEGTLYSDGAAHARAVLGEVAPLTDMALFAGLYSRGLLEKALPGMNGAFFVVIWDPAERTLAACNDRFGLYPNYWADNGRTFCLGGRVLCPVLARAVPGTWNPAGVAQLLTTGDYSGDETSVEGVSCFPQASVMVKRRGASPVFRRYWSYDYRPRGDGLPARELAAMMGEALIASVRNQSRSAHRVGVTLSGGLDSRCLAVSLSGLGGPVRTFSYGIEGCLDRVISHNVAHRIGSIHTECDFRYNRFEELFEAFGETSEAMQNLVDANMLPHIDLFARDVDLVLNGYAADLIVGGSFLRPRWMRPLSLDALSERLFEWRDSLLGEDALRQALAHDLPPIPAERLPSSLYRSLLGSCACESTPDTVDRFFLENRQRRNTAMGTVILRRSVESAACFFSYDLVDLVLGTPAELRIDHRIYIMMMKSVLPVATRDRWQRTLLPPSAPIAMAIGAKALLKGLRMGEKALGIRTVASSQSFSDFGAWFLGPLSGFAERVCGGGFPIADEILDPGFCMSTLESHRREGRQAGLIGAIASVRSFSLALGKARAGKSLRTMPLCELKLARSGAKD